MIQSLDKALNLLDFFDGEHPELSLMELTEKSGLQKSSVYKILQTFTANDFLQQNPSNKKYSLGKKIARLSNVFFKTNTVSSFLHEQLLKVAKATEENLSTA